jgi:arylsulfatase A-like enzyme
VETPSLDRLARRGFAFREAHIMGANQGAVCAPSRAMLMSGRTLFRVYDSLDGVPTFPEVMRQAGYETFVTGKWHQSESNPSARCSTPPSMTPREACATGASS